MRAYYIIILFYDICQDSRAYICIIFVDFLTFFDNSSLRHKPFQTAKTQFTRIKLLIFPKMKGACTR